MKNSSQDKDKSNISFQRIEDISLKGIKGPKKAFHNLSSENLVKEALRRREGFLSKSGALVAYSGKRCGRSPKDRFIVLESSTQKQIDWNEINRPISPHIFENLWEKVSLHVNSKERFTSEMHIGESEDHYLPLKITTETAWHSLFSRNMFINPKTYNPLKYAEWEIMHASNYVCDPKIDGTNSEAVVIINFASKKVLLAGMSYAGEIKKAMFSVQNFLLPEKEVMPMHCAANMAENGTTALFFGLSGTGKTTLSADPNRFLIGDDEHAWTTGKVFNMEGGCYAKTINLSEENEPLIWKAIKPGAILENVKMDMSRGQPIFSDTSITENGRCSYPLTHIEKREEKNYGQEPRHIIFLTCDTSGVLPPVSILDEHAAAYHFISGYTAKVGSTETGGDDNSVSQVFSACFGAPFMPRSPNEYAALLIDRIKKFGSQVYLVNTGWTGGPLGVGKRFPIPVTRAIITAILNNKLENTQTKNLNILNLNIPLSIDGVDSNLLEPEKCWTSPIKYKQAARALASLFIENMSNFVVTEEIAKSGPQCR